MRVDVGRRGEVAVSEPLLNLLHRNAVRQHHACTAVPEIVEADGTQSVVLQQLAKCRGDVVGLDKIAHLIDADVADVVRAVASSAQPLVFRLLPFQRPQTIPENEHQRQRPHAGLGLGRVGGEEHVLAVHIEGRDRMANRDGIAIEVDRLLFFP